MARVFHLLRKLKLLIKRFQCPIEITRGRFDACLRKMAEDGLRIALHQCLEDLHGCIASLLRLQLSRMGVELDRRGDFHGVIAHLLCLVGAIQRREQIRFGIEIFEPLLDLDRLIGPLQ